MTSPRPGLFPLAPPSASRLVVAWLQGYFGAGNVGLRRPQAAALPYRMVTVVAGTETYEKIRQCAVVSVHTFADNMDDAEYQSLLTHQRMLEFGPPLAPNQTVTITVPGGPTRDATADYVETKQIPIWADYEDDEIFRFVARYEIASRFVVVSS